MKDFVVEENIRTVLSLFDIESYYKENDEPFHIKQFKAILKAKGYKGRLYNRGTNLFDFPHFTHLSHPDIKCPKPTFGRKDKEEEVKEYPISLAFNEERKFVPIDDFAGDVKYCFYDVECTKVDAFCGVLLDGYKFSIIPLKKALGIFMNIADNYPDVIFIAYNDAYDGNVIVDADHDGGNPSDRNLTVRDARAISNNIIKEGEKKRFKKTKGIGVSTSSINLKYEYNNMSAYVNCFDAMTDLLHSTTSAEQSFVKGGLKYHCLKHGITWSESMSSDVYTYNQEDVENLRKLFYLEGGVEKIETIKTMLDLSVSERRSRPKALSSKLAVGMYMKKTFTDGLICSEFLNVNRRKKFIEETLREFDVVETPIKGGTTIAYSRNQQNILNGGLGGIHAVTDPGFYNCEHIYDIDFSSFYPNIMCHEMSTFIVDSAKRAIRKLTDERLQDKKEGNKIQAESKKIFINSIYGKARTFGTEEPSCASLVTCLAKVIMIELLREVEKAGYKVIDVNTDGIMCIGDENVQKIVDSVMGRYNIPLEITPLAWIAYSTTGCYIARVRDGALKSKGSWASSASYNSKVLINDEKWSFNWLNVPEIVSVAVEQNTRNVPPPIISYKRGVSEEASYGILTELPFTLDPNEKIQSCSISQKHILNNTPTPIDSALGWAMLSAKFKCLSK